MRGSGRFSIRPSSIIYVDRASQSPSLRGSGRFRPALQRRSAQRPRVSIPFIAGQWSLPPDAAAGRRRRRGLNPLHCGAVVASHGPGSVPAPRATGLNPLHCGAVVASKSEIEARAAAGGSQSPSLRGSGRFFERPARRTAGGQGLNPLHCGAVVASLNRPPMIRRATRVSIPFIAGQWSLPDPDWIGRGRPRPVSIPFIAGQWSLPGGASPAPDWIGRSQSPSLRGSGRFGEGPPGSPPATCLNPLHCGAVVASASAMPPVRRFFRSQSPSLRGSGRFARQEAAARAEAEGLNPLHCGAVVASSAQNCRRSAATLSQSPSLRGSGRFWRLVVHDEERFMQVSIPFIAGQWSLRPHAPVLLTPAWSQSPSLRGSGRFVGGGAARRGGARGSQSPSLRGSGRFLRSPG